jgi:hypothetical protein
VLHEKADRIPAAAATKTFINFFRRGNRERRCFFIMKWTKTEVVSASFFQPDKTTDDLGDVDPAEYLLYGLLRYQVY